MALWAQAAGYTLSTCTFWEGGGGGSLVSGLHSPYRTVCHTSWGVVVSCPDHARLRASGHETRGVEPGDEARERDPYQTLIGY